MEQADDRGRRDGGHPEHDRADGCARRPALGERDGGLQGVLRKTFGAAQQDLTASGDFQVVKEGASGGNVPLFRFLDPTSARVVSVFRQNATGAIGLTFANGTRGTTTGKLALGHVGARRDARDHERGGEHRRGRASTGRMVYSSATQSLGTAGVSTIQIGNDTAAQAFTIVADTIDVENAAPATPSPPINTVKPTISGAAAAGRDAHGQQRHVDRHGDDHVHLPLARCPARGHLDLLGTAQPTPSSPATRARRSA